jgi:hypothetical protein
VPTQVLGNVEPEVCAENLRRGHEMCEAADHESVHVDLQGSGSSLERDECRPRLRASSLCVDARWQRFGDGDDQHARITVYDLRVTNRHALAAGRCQCETGERRLNPLAELERFFFCDLSIS